MKGRVRWALVAVALAAAGCELHKPEQYVLGQTALDVAFRLEPSRPSLPADGVSRMTIVAVMDSATSTANRKVTFSTSLGTLSGAGKSGTTVEVDADSTWRATVELQSDLKTGVANVRASAGSLVRSTDIPFTPVSAAEVMTLSVANAAPPADGATLTQVSAVVQQVFAGRTLKFELGPAGRGELTRTEVIVDATGRAATAIKSPGTAGGARLTAILEGFSATTDLNFVRALPDQIHATASIVQVKAGTATTDPTTTITASLLRNIGKVTEGTVVSFAATQENGEAVGVFGDIKLSDQSGESTAVFHPGATTYRGAVNVVVRVSGTSVTGSTRVAIIDP